MEELEMELNEQDDDDANEVKTKRKTCKMLYCIKENCMYDCLGSSDKDCNQKVRRST